MLKANTEICVHFIGIGGIGMSGIAEVLLSLGYKVSGSDASESGNVIKLKKLGAKISIGHKAENVIGSTVLVYSSAINDSNPEIVYAKDNNIPIMRRAEMLAELMRLKLGLAIAGTHGKTTTTSFLATIIQESHLDPTYIIGGIVKNLNGHAKVGKGQYLVAEADESDGSFLMLNPIMSVITNIDNDHLDFYGSEAAIEEAFLEFANKVPFYGCTALNKEDPKLKMMMAKMRKPYLTFGFEEEGFVADYEARDIKFEKTESSFDLYVAGKKSCRIQINLPGRHNILNALGAIALAHKLGIDLVLISESIKKFDGVGRRFQKLYEDEQVSIFDDYGHHPTEIRETVKAALEVSSGKPVYVIFEPHRYTRTRDCWEQFLHCFNGVQHVFIAPIYAASEKEMLGINSQALVSDLNRLHPMLATSLSDSAEIGELIKDLKQKNGIVITMGAGSIGRVIREVLGVS